MTEFLIDTSPRLIWKLRVRVWPNAKAMHRAHRMGNGFGAMFCSDTDLRTQRLGTLHFFRQRLWVSYFAHEIDHARVYLMHRLGLVQAYDDEVMDELSAEFVQDSIRNLLDGLTERGFAVREQKTS